MVICEGGLCVKNGLVVTTQGPSIGGVALKGTHFIAVASDDLLPEANRFAHISLSPCQCLRREIPQNYEVSPSSSEQIEVAPVL
jgi:hypothetical protein